MPEIKHSLDLFDRAEHLIPSCSQTFSKGWRQYPFGVSPIFLEKANGCRVWDVDGNQYIDWPMALGPVLLGHNHPRVNAAVKKAIDNGVAFSLPHCKEVELAEKLCRTIPCADMVRFGKNGSDATSGAVRAARAYTDREMIACCGYHGWQDWYIGTTSRNLGVPVATKKLTRTFAYNDIESLKELFIKYPDKIACVILEPTSLEPPANGFLQQVNDLAHANGSLVIYDECWTGFRWAPGGAQEYFGVTPDLACFGKALGNGFPISVIAGHRHVMEIFDKIFYSFTFGGDLVGITAGLAVLDELADQPVIDHIWTLGDRLGRGINRLIDQHQLGNRIRLTGFPPKLFLSFKDLGGNDDQVLKSVVQQEMISRSHLYAGYHVMSFSHTEDEIEAVLTAYDEVFSLIAAADSPSALRSMLHGSPVEPVFRNGQ